MRTTLTTSDTTRTARHRIVAAMAPALIAVGLLATPAGAASDDDSDIQAGLAAVLDTIDDVPAVNDDEALAMSTAALTTTAAALPTQQILVGNQVNWRAVLPGLWNVTPLNGFLYRHTWQFGAFTANKITCLPLASCWAQGGRVWSVRGTTLTIHNASLLRGNMPFTLLAARADGKAIAVRTHEGINELWVRHQA